MPHRCRLLFVLIALVALLGVAQLVRAQAIRVYLPVLADSRPTATRTVTATRTATITPTLAPVDLFPNGHFEQAAAFWFIGGDGRIAFDGQPVAPRSGQRAFVVQVTAGEVGQGVARHDVVTMPTAPHELRFFYQASSPTAECSAELSSVAEVNLLIGAQFERIWALPLCVATSTNAWQLVTIDLSPYTGRLIEVEFKAFVVEDGAWFAVDDASITPRDLNAPTSTPTSTPSMTPTRDARVCAPEYPTVCILPPPPDLDCRDISHRNFVVLSPDRHVFDTDDDGIGCEG